tara:strand:+ start:281 stop:790 length:510 start_codon:yes stop_codon:yes gene_type:complete
MQSFDWAADNPASAASGSSGTSASGPPAPKLLDRLSEEEEKMVGSAHRHLGSRVHFTARRVADTILNTEAPAMLLKPSFANIHAFQALTDCAVLDVLMPPYDGDAGRDCHYFAMDQSAPDTDQSTVQLRVIAAPADLEIRNGRYVGPVVEQGSVQHAAHAAMRDDAYVI